MKVKIFYFTIILFIELHLNQNWILFHVLIPHRAYLNAKMPPLWGLKPILKAGKTFW